MLSAREYPRCRVCSPEWVAGAVVFPARTSMPLFLVNGFLRHPFFGWARQSGSNLVHIGCLLRARGERELRRRMPARAVRAAALILPASSAQRWWRW